MGAFTALSKSASVTLVSETYDIRILKASSTVTYIGKAAKGSALSASVWQIKRITFGSQIAIEWADNDDLFDNIWNNCASLSYGPV